MSLATIISSSFSNFYRQLTKNYVNNLTSTSDNLPLAASQGKALNDKIESVNTNMQKLVPIGYIFTWSDRKITKDTGTSYSNEIISNAPTLTTAQAVHDYFGFGTWQRITNRFLYSGENTAKMGGEETVTLTSLEVPSHYHKLNLTTQEDGGHTHVVQLEYALDATVTGKSARVSHGGGNLTGATEKNAIGTALNSNDTVHTHAINGTTGEPTTGGQAHENMPPYMNVYMWQRIA